MHQILVFDVQFEIALFATAYLQRLIKKVSAEVLSIAVLSQNREEINPIHPNVLRTFKWFGLDVDHVLFISFQNAHLMERGMIIVFNPEAEAIAKQKIPECTVLSLSNPEDDQNVKLLTLGDVGHIERTFSLLAEHFDQSLESILSKIN